MEHTHAFALIGSALFLAGSLIFTCSRTDASKRLFGRLALCLLLSGILSIGLAIALQK